MNSTVNSTVNSTINSTVNSTVNSTRVLLENDSKCIHLRIQKIGTRRTLTIIEGLETVCDKNEVNDFFDKILKDLKKKFNCSGSSNSYHDEQRVIKLQGDHREGIKEFILLHGFTKENLIIIHGY